VTVGAHAVAHADAPPSANAAELLDADGTSLMQQHRYAEACPKLAQSDHLQPGTGVIMRLALCYEQSGKTASAWSTYREAAGRARRSNDDSLAQLATKHASALEPRLAKVTLRLSSGASPAQVEVRCDGVLLDGSVLGTPIPMDPGAHTVETSATGRQPFRKTFVVTQGDAPATVAIDIGPGHGTSPPSNPSTDEGGSSRSTQRTLALVAGGVGLAGVVVGSILGVAAISNWNQARSECTNGTTGCSPDALGREQTVRTDALWSTIAFSVGGAGLVGGALLWWTAPSVDAHRIGLALGGRF